MRQLSPREARLVAVLILVALITFVSLLVIHPIVSGFSERSERRELLLARYAANDRTIAAIPRLRRRAEAQRETVDRFTLSAADAGSGAEVLRDRLQNAVTAVDGDFRGGEDVPVSAGWVGARVNTRLTSAQLGALLANLQNAQPYLIVNSLVIGSDDTLVTGAAATLDVQIEASIPLRLSAAR